MKISSSDHLPRHQALIFVALLALAGCAGVPAPPPVLPTPIVSATPAAMPSVQPSIQAASTAPPATIAQIASPIPPEPSAPAAPIIVATPAPGANLLIPPPTATPTLPEPTIGPDNLAALRPLREFGMGGARKVAIAPGGKILAVATTAGVAFFELPTLRHLRFDPIEAGAWQLAWSPNAQQ